MQVIQSDLHSFYLMYMEQLVIDALLEGMVFTTGVGQPALNVADLFSVKMETLEQLYTRLSNGQNSLAQLVGKTKENKRAQVVEAIYKIRHSAAQKAEAKEVAEKEALQQARRAAKILAERQLKGMEALTDEQLMELASKA